MPDALVDPHAPVDVRTRSRRTWRTTPFSLGIVALVLAAVGLAPAGAAADVPSTSALSYGTNGTVQAVARLGNTIYLGGNFTQIGAATGHGAALATSDGAFDPAMPTVSGGYEGVKAVASDGSGGWYVGGDFTHVGGVARNGLVHILADKTVDPNFDPNLNGYTVVDALVVEGSTLYVGGYFTSMGGQPRSNIAAIDTTTGDATSWNPNATGPVQALAVSGDGTTVYAGGGFEGASSIGGADRQHIAALNNTNGDATTWNPNANATVYSLAVSGSTVYVGGAFGGANSIGGAARLRIAALDANTDTNNATPWNPSSNGPVQALAVSDDGLTVYAGGGFFTIGSAQRNNIAALDAATGNATSWDPNANSSVVTLALDGSTLYAGGYFSSIGGQQRNNIAALDTTMDTNNATSWDPNMGGGVNALAVSGSTVYAGGQFPFVNGTTRNNLAALDATSGAPTNWDANADSEVSALALSGSTLYAGGSFSSIGGQPRNYIGALDTTTNTDNATPWDPQADGCVCALAVYGSTVYAGGLFSNIGGQPHNNIAALNNTNGDATSWTPDVNGPVNALALSATGSTVYVGGFFDTVTGATRNNIAAMDAGSGDATNWNPNSQADVYALAVSGSTVYAGGEFNGANSIGGAGRNFVAALDANTDTNNATSWNPNPNGPVYALAASPGALYAGGAFDAIGTGPAAFVAAFVEAPQNTVAPSISGLQSAGHNLTCLKGTWSGGTPQTYAYQWYRDNVLIAGEIASTYAVQAGDTGHVIKCRVTATNLGGSMSATSAGKVIQTPPANTTAPSISGIPASGHNLTCAKGTWSGSTPLTYTYKWFRDNVAIGAQTAATYTVKGIDIGHVIKCQVKAANNGGSAIATSAGVVIKTPPANTTAPTISGTPKVGKTLTCALGTWSGSTPITYSRQWMQSGAPIAGATGSSYVVQAADAGKFVSCKVTAHNVAGTASKVSAAVKITS